MMHDYGYGEHLSVDACRSAQENRELFFLFVFCFTQVSCVNDYYVQIVFSYMPLLMHVEMVTFYLMAQLHPR